ncbi:MAG: hypothetical protein WDN69_11160 [Aliidongia sp.]
MNGWGDSIRAAIVQGHAAARNGLDPTQRDKVMSVRRQLGEYARMARFVGSLSPGMKQNFRRLGRALDEVSAVLLVTLGESLASVGFATGYYLLQVPLPELQQRRDAVIYALRNFNGGAQQAYGPDDWPRGVDAYRRLYQWLEEQGQGDLRSPAARIRDCADHGYADHPGPERHVGRAARARRHGPARYRALPPHGDRGAGRHVAGGRAFRPLAAARILSPGAGAVRRDLPACRRPQAAAHRPAALLLYGLYYTNQLEHDNALFDLIAARGTLATIFDGLFPSNSARGVQPQVLLDMLLLELDRGIDLLAMGSSTSEGGPTEWRAIAFWAIIKVIYQLLTNNDARRQIRRPCRLGQRLADRESYRQRVRAGSAPDQFGLPTGVTNAAGLHGAFTRYFAIRQTGVPAHLDDRQRKSVAEELRVQESWKSAGRTSSAPSRWRRVTRRRSSGCSARSSTRPATRSISSICRGSRPRCRNNSSRASI